MTTLTETYQTAPAQPDISYLPDPEKYALRTQYRVKNEKVHLRGLPTGFPQKLVSTFAWEGEDLANEYKYVYALSEQEIAEVESALAHFKCTMDSYVSFQGHFELTGLFAALQKSLGYISQETFPLPTLHATLRSISRELHLSRGFKVVRGLPVWKHGREDNIVMYAGVSSHVAPIRGRQDKKFKGKPADVVLHHIKDLSTTADKGRIGSPAYTAEKQVFHTDAGDIVSLLALSVAAEGGRSKLSSSWRVYNELAKTRPDLIATLAEDWVAEKSVSIAAIVIRDLHDITDTSNSFGSTDRPYSRRPLLHYLPASDGNEERVIIQYARRTFTGYQALPRSPNIPPITEAQAEALDALHFLADRFHVGLDFRQGDIQYVNNLSIFHARDGFKDTRDQQ